MIAACDFQRMTTKTIEHLQNQIEELVREHLAMQRSAATTAVERAFASGSAPSNLLGATYGARSALACHCRLSTR